MKFFFTILLCICCYSVFSQTDSSNEEKKIDTPIVAKPKPVIKPIAKVPTASRDSIMAKRRKDSSVRKDSLVKIAMADSLKTDSIKKANVQVKSSTPIKDTTTYAAIMYHGFIPVAKPPFFQVSKDRNIAANDGLFYLLIGVIGLVAFVKISFPKYFRNLFVLFFQTSFRQKQTRDQLLQDRLASLITNFIFLISVSIFASLIAQRQHLISLDFWWLFLYSLAILTIVYFGKYLFLRFAGWVFNENEAANLYLFVVFMVNKIIGVLLIPFLLILAFSAMPLVQIAITLSLLLMGGIFLYRYVVSLGTIRSSLKVNALHFFLYLCAVEVLPLLLMYKVLFNFIRHYP